MGSEGLNYNSALLARLKVEFPSKYTVVVCEKPVIVHVIVISLLNETVSGVLKNSLNRVRTFQIKLEHKIFKVFIA